MEDSKTREKVLKKIRNALINKTRNPYPNVDLDTNVFVVGEEGPEINFASKFNDVGGQFVYCEDELEFIEKILHLATEMGWRNFVCREQEIKSFLDQVEFPYRDEDPSIAEAEVTITLCEALISRSGSIMVSSAQQAGRKAFIYSPVHIVLAYSSQIVPNIKDGYKLIRNKYGKLPSLVSLITGPGLSSDIERNLVYGMHGPCEVYLFLIDDQQQNG
ncbi:MAG: LutC/YkgG family protein [Bacteroidia bacterium]